MNLESQSPKKSDAMFANDDLDFDFKPLTSGLGFHSNKTTEIKPAFADKPVASMPQSMMPISTPAPLMRNDQNVYQNDLSLFYNRETTAPAPELDIKEEKIVRLATKTQRTVAYLLDLGLLLSCTGLVLTVMARLVEMDLMDVWSKYPNEITPLVVTLFCGFYLIYFSIFEKTAQSSMGKYMMGISVVDQNNKSQSFSKLLLRSFVSLTNFVSLGLFSYFDLQNKVSGSKVIKVK